MADTMDLKVWEHNIIGRELGQDPLQAIADGAEGRWTALALTLWLLDRRTDPAAKKEDYLELTLAEVERRHAEGEAEAEAEEAGPTEPEPSQS